MQDGKAAMKTVISLVPLCAVCGVAILACSAATPVATEQLDAGGTKQSDGQAAVPAEAATDSLHTIAGKIIVVNEAIGIGDLRICFDEADNYAEPLGAIVPQTNYPGFASGG